MSHAGPSVNAWSQSGRLDYALGHERACPRCGSRMVLRTVKLSRNAGSRFWRCSSFPNCTVVQNIDLQYQRLTWGQCGQQHERTDRNTRSHSYLLYRPRTGLLVLEDQSSSDTAHRDSRSLESAGVRIHAHEFRWKARTQCWRALIAPIGRVRLGPLSAPYSPR